MIRRSTATLHRPGRPKKPPARRTVAAVRIQAAWARYLLVKHAKLELEFRRADRAARRIQLFWRSFVVYLNRRIPKEFSTWLANRSARLRFALTARVKLAAVHRRHAAIVIGRQCRRALLRIRLHKLFLHRKAWRIQRCFRRAQHRERSRCEVLRSIELLWLLRFEAQCRSLVAAEERNWRRHLLRGLHDPKLQQYVEQSCSIKQQVRLPKPPPRELGNAMKGTPLRSSYPEHAEWGCPPAFFVRCTPVRTTFTPKSRFSETICHGLPM